MVNFRLGTLLPPYTISQQCCSCELVRTLEWPGFSQPAMLTAIISWWWWPDPASFALRRNSRILTYPAAATALAVSTEGSQEAIDHLDGTENHLDASNDQQDGEEGQIPGDHILGLYALAPQGLVVKIITAGDRGTGRKATFVKCVRSPTLAGSHYHFSCAKQAL